MRLSNNKWAKSRVNHLALFYAQSMHEQLDQRSWDNYKVPSLDTLSKIHEVRTICIQIRKGKAQKVHIRTPLRELIKSIEADSIVQDLLQHSIGKVLEVLRKKDISTDELQQTLRYVYSKIENKYQPEMRIQY